MTCFTRLRLGVVLAALLVPISLDAQAGSPETHTVRKGDTLWDLARQYLSDPLLWPEIYRLNTDVVEDPHWIYPGEVLKLSAAGAVSAVPLEDTPLPVAEMQPQVDSVAPQMDVPVAVVEAAAPDSAAEAAAPDLAEAQVGDIAEAPPSAGDSVDLTPLVGVGRSGVSAGPDIEQALERAYRPLRRSEFYSGGFLSEGMALPLGRVVGVLTPSEIESSSNASIAMLYRRIAVTAPAGATYRVGDTLLTVIVDRDIDGFGSVIVPTGLVRVLDASRPQAVAEVIALYGQVRDGQGALPAEKFMDPGNVRPVPISDGVRGRIIAHRDRHVLTGPQNIIFLDRGRKDGVALGDSFELLMTPRERVDAPDIVSEVVARAQVVHVGERTATALITWVKRGNIEIGSEARQVAKLPS